MAKRAREEDHAKRPTLDELCQSVKRLHTLNRVENAGKQGIEDSSRLHNNVEGSFGMEGRPDESIIVGTNGNLDTTIGRRAELVHGPPVDMSSLYTETNRMLRELHFERLHRLSIDRGGGE